MDPGKTVISVYPSCVFVLPVIAWGVTNEQQIVRNRDQEMAWSSGGAYIYKTTILMSGDKRYSFCRRNPLLQTPSKAMRCFSRPLTSSLRLPGEMCTESVFPYTATAICM